MVSSIARKRSRTRLTVLARKPGQNLRRATELSDRRPACRGVRAKPRSEPRREVDRGLSALGGRWFQGPKLPAAGDVQPPGSALAVWVKVGMAITAISARAAISFCM